LYIEAPPEMVKQMMIRGVGHRKDVDLDIEKMNAEGKNIPLFNNTYYL